MAALSRMVDRQDPVKLVAGLPISHYRRHKAELVEILKAQHGVTLIGRNGDRIDTVVRIADVRDGATCQAMLGSDRRLKGG